MQQQTKPVNIATTDIKITGTTSSMTKTTSVTVTTTSVSDISNTTDQTEQTETDWGRTRTRNRSKTTTSQSRSKSPAPPRFQLFSEDPDGLPWSSFIMKFERIAQGRGWSEEKKLDKLYDCPADKALEYATRSENK